MSDQARQDGQVSGAVMLYTQPEPLNPEQHGRLGIRTSPTPYKFALTAHAVPLVNVFRQDEIRPSLSNEEALRNAPAKANGLFMVPKIVE